MSYKIATYQAQDIQDDIPSSIHAISLAMEEADANGINVLCFQECFLQGYTLNETETRKRALNLASAQFTKLLKKLADYKTAAIVGVIEEENGLYFNTAAVIQRGALLGKYRKVHLFEKNFQPGENYPVFAVDGLCFGINICYDARFAEGAKALATQGAKVIFYPLNNRLPTEKAIKYREMHLPNLIERAKETGCWIVSSDVVVEDAHTIGYGFSAIVNPSGEIIQSIPELKTGMVSCDILG
jgi:predicted amidohydrolase